MQTAGPTPTGELGGGAGTCQAWAARAVPGTQGAQRSLRSPACPCLLQGLHGAHPPKGSRRWWGHPPARTVALTLRSLLQIQVPQCIEVLGNLLKRTLMGGGAWACTCSIWLLASGLPELPLPHVSARGLLLLRVRTASAACPRFRKSFLHVEPRCYLPRGMIGPLGHPCVCRNQGCSAPRRVPCELVRSGAACSGFSRCLLQG